MHFLANLSTDPFNCYKVLILRTSLNLGHFRPRKAAEVAVPPPTAPRPPHTLCGHRRRRDTFPRGSAERSAPPQLSGERRGAASGSFGESPSSCTAYRGEFSAPEAFVPHAARRDEVRAPYRFMAFYRELVLALGLILAQKTSKWVQMRSSAHYRGPPGPYHTLSFLEHLPFPIFSFSR